MISFISFISHFIFSFIFQSLLLFSLRTVSQISSSHVASWQTCRQTWLIHTKMYAAKTLNPSVSVDRTSLHRTSLQCNTKSDADTWTGLPLGVKFDPSDQEIISYLLAKVNSENHTSDFVDRYITTIDDEDGICFAHPGDLPGMKDRHVSFFFHKLSNAHRSGERKRRKIKGNNGEIGRWKQTGRARSVLLDGVTEGYKKILVLQKSNNEKTEWVMLVPSSQIVSDLFQSSLQLGAEVTAVDYCREPSQCDLFQSSLQLGAEVTAVDYCREPSQVTLVS
ncbi:hypothetical protein OROGR_006356 [Orobanche gracilis]